MVLGEIAANEEGARERVNLPRLGSLEAKLTHSHLIEGVSV